MSEEALERVRQAHLLLVKERQVALARAVAARKQMAAAQTEYADAVLIANALGVPNTKLARSMGVSETAVRNFVKRHKG